MRSGRCRSRRGGRCRVLTLDKQIYKQWREGHSEGVSRWLFLGQTAASAGCTLYSALEHSWVFVVTNTLMLLAGLIGYAIVLHHRRAVRAGRQPTCP